MRLKIICFVATIFFLTVVPLHAQLKKVRFPVSTASIAQVPSRIAEIKGIYGDQGLAIEVVLIRSSVGMQALPGGANKEVPTSQVFDFSFVGKALR